MGGEVMSGFLEPRDVYVVARLRAALKACESDLADDFDDLVDRIGRLNHCVVCGNFGEHSGTCSPCLDLDAIADDRERDDVRRVQ